MLQRIVVVGGGVAGCLAAVNLKQKLPDLAVELLDVPVEEPAALHTVPHFHQYLHEQLSVPLGPFLELVGPIWNLGTRYHWGPRPFFDITFFKQVDTQFAVLPRVAGFYLAGLPDWSEAGLASAMMSRGRVFARGNDGRPQINGPDFGYQLDAARLRTFLLGFAQQHGVAVRQAELIRAVPGAEGIERLELKGQPPLSADLYVDATEQAARLDIGGSRVRYEELLCDRAVMGIVPRAMAGDLAAHVTLGCGEAGWTWRIEHESFATCGYAYSARFTSDDAAGAELCRCFPGIEQVRPGPWSQGRLEKPWCGNVVAVGGAAGWIDPLYPLHSFIVAWGCEALAQSLVDCDRVPRPTLLGQYNKRHRRLMETARDFNGLMNRFNTRLDTPFWQEARRRSRIGELDILLRQYQEIGPSTLYGNTMLYEQDPIGLEGYFGALLGMQVAHQSPVPLTEAEQATWAQLRGMFARKAAGALSVSEALSLFRPQPASIA